MGVSPLIFSIDATHTEAAIDSRHKAGRSLASACAVCAYSPVKRLTQDTFYSVAAYYFLRPPAVSYSGNIS